MEKCNSNPTEEKQEVDKVSLEEQIGLIFNSEDEAPEVDGILTQIAKQIGKVPTLKQRNLDSLDFHDMSVWRLRELLRVSYELGKVHGKSKSISLLSEEAQENYLKTYLEFEVGDTIEVRRFYSLDCQYRNIFKDRKFNVLHKLTDGHIIQYSCQFKDFEATKNLYDQLNDADGFEFALLRSQLSEQEVEIVNISIV